MQDVVLSLTEVFRAKPAKTCEVNVCKTVSHFNWFAKYDARPTENTQNSANQFKPSGLEATRTN